ncbi:MAG: nickel pincer cofactor biosynthesis protein LarB [Chloroflexota bacterium]|nr:nickel pincer cofactor biosynthesis protein LarB [Chloroflexota bacterium]
MDAESLSRLLTAVKDGRLEVKDAVERLRDLPFEDIGDAKIDHHRALRTGLPEVVFAQSKTPRQVADAFSALVGKSPLVMATRADSTAFEAVAALQPDAIYFERARIIAMGRLTALDAFAGNEYVVVATGGTADLPVAEEAAITLELLGHSVKRLYDVGVAGIHRLLAHRQTLFDASLVVAVAGMEGALASVVAGLVSCPLVAVPTSVGYGANFGGLAPLLTMLNSCAPGVAVVNIDNGFGAAAFAHLVLTRQSRTIG